MARLVALRLGIPVREAHFYAEFRGRQGDELDSLSGVTADGIRIQTANRSFQADSLGRSGVDVEADARFLSTRARFLPGHPTLDRYVFARPRVHRKLVGRHT